MSNTARRALAAGAVSVIGFVGLSVPAQADETLGCDPALVAVAVDEAKAEAWVAKKAFTSHTRTAMKALVKDLKAEERAEAKAAAQEARQLWAAAKKDPALRAAAREARKAARAEAKEARQVQRAGQKEAKRLVKVERRALKAEWDTAKKARQELKAYAEACAEEPAAEPVEPTAPVEGEPTET